MSKAHKPGPMRILTAVEMSANAAYRWREQYKDWRDEHTFADGTTKGSIDAALNRCKHTPENITRIINEGWARPQCECCDGYADVVVQFTPEWGSSTTEFCGPCLAAALSLATGEYK